MPMDTPPNSPSMRPKSLLLRYALATFFISGMLLGLFRINAFRERLQADEEAAPIAPAASPFASENVPDRPTGDLPNGEPEPIVNSEPLEIGEIISGAQSDLPVPIAKTPDQLRYERNVLRDFGQFLDPAVRDPDAEGNQRAKNAMVNMLLQRSSAPSGNVP